MYSFVDGEQDKMNSNSMEVDLSAKQENENTNEGNLSYKASSSSQWMRTKDPRIVRVSRAFGGKDRHSKVCTIRGLRDRRVRLSVPTAIKLYDLQDRLGFNQPSKVVDWLLDTAKKEIDELPPLPVIPAHNFGQNYQTVLTSHQNTASSSNEGLRSKEDIDLEDSRGLLRSNFWSSSAYNWEDIKSKEVAREVVNNKEEKEEDSEGQNASSTYNFLTKTNYHPSFQGILNNAMPYGTDQNFMPSNISLPYPGSYGFTSQADYLPNLNIVTMPSTLSLSTGSQILVCPPGAAQSYFPSFTTSSTDIDPRQIGQIQMLSSNSSMSNPFASPLHSTNQIIRPLHFNLTPKNVLHSQESDESQSTKDH